MPNHVPENLQGTRTASVSPNGRPQRFVIEDVLELAGCIMEPETQAACSNFGMFSKKALVAPARITFGASRWNWHMVI
jgi:hypothetical protein